MAKRDRTPVEAYHDRVAGLYDTIYNGDPYWEAVFLLTWRNILKHLPADLSTRCLDVGCGTGRWGLRLAKAGYRTDFLDISQKMLDQVAGKLTQLDKEYIDVEALYEAPAAEDIAADETRHILWHASLDNLASLPSQSYGFIVGQGDPLNCAEKPGRAFKEMARLLKPGGVMLMSVDNRLQGIYHYFQAGDIPGLKDFLKTGKTNWVTDNEAERYRITMFTPGQIRSMCRERGLEFLGMIGKTVLPLRRFKDLLVEKNQRDDLIRLEESLHGEEALLANAAHLEFAARHPREI